MSHDLTDRTKFILGSSPRLGDEDVFGIGSITVNEVTGAWGVIRALDGTFHAVPCHEHPRKGHADQREFHVAESFTGTIYGPIAAGTTLDDVEGATFAFDDGTHWHFAHCSPHEQVDLAAEARTFTEQQFSSAITAALIKAHEATNAPVEAQAVAKVRALAKFATAAGAAAYDRVIGETLGYYHRDPHHDHLRDLAVAGIAAALEAWMEAGQTDKAVRGDVTHVTSTTTAVTAALATNHTIEWRAARVARLKKEKEAADAAAAAESAGDGSGD